jgi:hypothetical protein
VASALAIRHVGERGQLSHLRVPWLELVFLDVRLEQMVQHQPGLRSALSNPDGHVEVRCAFAEYVEGKPSHISGTDSSGVIETLLARRLIEDDPRFGRPGRPSFLATTADFLRSLGRYFGRVSTGLPVRDKPATGQVKPA